MGRAYQNRKASMAKTSDQNAKVYSSFSREIYMVAKSGGPDPDGNLALRSLLDRAKKAKSLAMSSKKLSTKLKVVVVRITLQHATKAMAPADHSRSSNV